MMKIIDLLLQDDKRVPDRWNISKTRHL